MNAPVNAHQLSHPEITREVSAELRADIARIKARLTVAEVNDLDRKYREILAELEPYKQSSFSLHDLRCVMHDAGFDLEDCGGDPAVFIPGATDDDRLEFQIRVAQASIRYAEPILKAATWLPVTECFFWNAGEIERRGA